MGVLRLHPLELLLRLVEFFPVRLVRQLSEYVSGSAVIQCLVGSPGDVFQSVVLVMEIRHVVVNPFEGIFRKIPGGKIHVSPRRIRLGPTASG